MKKILTIIAAGMILIGCQTTDTAQAGIEIIDGTPITVNPPASNPKVTDWYRGDIVGAQTFCKDEESIMKIVLADTKSENAVRTAMYIGSMTGECLIMQQPIGVPIMDIVAEYLDFAKRPSVVLVVALPQFIEGAVAYVIAGGRKGPPKEEEVKGRAI